MTRLTRRGLVAVAIAAAAVVIGAAHASAGTYGSSSSPAPHPSCSGSIAPSSAAFCSAVATSSELPYYCYNPIECAPGYHPCKLSPSGPWSPCPDSTPAESTTPAGSSSAAPTPSTSATSSAPPVVVTTATTPAATSSAAAYPPAVPPLRELPPASGSATTTTSSSLANTGSGHVGLEILLGLGLLVLGVVLWLVGLAKLPIGRHRGGVK